MLKKNLRLTHKRVGKLIALFMCALIPLRVGALCLAERQETFSRNVAQLIEYIYSQGYRCTLGEAFRTHEQAIIYSHNGKGIVNSKHCERLAIDLNLVDLNGQFVFDETHYEKFGEYWEKLSPFNRWGGRWIHRPDTDHFEMD